MKVDSRSMRRVLIFQPLYLVLCLYLVQFTTNILGIPRLVSSASSSSKAEKVISVQGSARVSVEPDTLIVSFGVQIRAFAAKDALKQASTVMHKVIESLKGIDISVDEISTAHFQIAPEYDYSSHSQQRFIGYIVSNQITVSTEKLEKAAEIIDTCIGAGATRVDSVSFSLSAEKTAKAKDDLLGNAVQNAYEKANKALSVLNCSVKGVKSINLSEGRNHNYGGFEMEALADAPMMRSSGKMRPTPIFSGKDDIEVSANVQFFIKEGTK